MAGRSPPAPTAIIGRAERGAPSCICLSFSAIGRADFAAGNRQRKRRPSRWCFLYKLTRRGTSRPGRPWIMSYPSRDRSGDAGYTVADGDASKFGDHRASQVVEEAGAAEEYYPDGTLRWRRVQRRRTAELLPGLPEQISRPRRRTTSHRLGVIAASFIAQLIFWAHMGAVLIGDDLLGAGRGGAIGYVCGSAIATLVVWRLGRR